MSKVSFPKKKVDAPAIEKPAIKPAPETGAKKASDILYGAPPKIP